MLRILLLALIAATAGPAAAQQKAKASTGYTVEFAEARGGPGAPPLARCAVIRYRVAGEAEKATSFCVFLGSNGTPLARNDLESPNKIVSFDGKPDVAGNFDHRFGKDFPKRDPKADFSGLIAAEADGNTIRRFLLEGTTDGTTDTAVRTIEAPAALEKNEEHAQQYQKLKGLLEQPPRSPDPPGPVTQATGAAPPAAVPATSNGIFGPVIDCLGLGPKPPPPAPPATAALESEIARLKATAQQMRDDAAAKDKEIAALKARLQSLSRFEAWADTGSSGTGGGDAAAFLIAYFWAFQPGMQLLGPSAGLMAPPAVGILVLLLSGSAIGALLARRPGAEPQRSSDAGRTPPAPTPARAADAMPTRGPIDHAFDGYAMSRHSSLSARIRSVEDMLRLLARSDRRFDDPAALLKNTAEEIAKLESALDVPLAEMSSRIDRERQQAQALHTLIGGAEPAQLQQELWRDWEAHTIQPVLERARQLERRVSIFQQVLNELGTDGRQIIGQINDERPPDTNALRRRLAGFEAIRMDLGIPQDRLSDTDMAVKQVWQALKRLIPDLNPNQPTTLHAAIVGAVTQFAVAVSPPDEDGAPPRRSLPEIAVALKARQAEAEQRYREGDDAVRKYDRWYQLLADRFGPPVGEDEEAQVDAWAATVRDGRAKAERFDKLTGELEVQRTRSESRWRLAAALLTRVGRRPPDPDDASALETAIYRVETDDADLFLLRAGLASIMSPLDQAVGTLTAAGRDDVVALLALDQFRAELAHFADTLEILDPSTAHEPTYYWDRLISPSIIFLHKLMRAEMVLQTYFTDDPVFEAIRWRVCDVAWLMRCAARHAGARCRTASLLQPAPADASLRYHTTPEFRAIPEIRRKVLERETLGGEFAVDLHAAGFAAPFSNTALTLVLYNPADWV